MRTDHSNKDKRIYDKYEEFKDEMDKLKKEQNLLFDELTRELEEYKQKEVLKKLQ